MSKKSTVRESREIVQQARKVPCKLLTPVLCSVLAQIWNLSPLLGSWKLYTKFKSWRINVDHTVQVTGSGFPMYEISHLVSLCLVWMTMFLSPLVNDLCCLCDAPACGVHSPDVGPDVAHVSLLGLCCAVSGSLQSRPTQPLLSIFLGLWPW